MARHWTAGEDIIAGRVSDAVAAARRPLLGTAAVVKAARLPAGSTRKVQSIMPRAVELHPLRHPGVALIYVPRRGAYLSTSDRDLIIESILDAQLKKVTTSLQRAAAAAEALDPASLHGATVRSHIGAALLALQSPVWDALVADVLSGH
jgi:hypothetical protein